MKPNSTINQTLEWFETVKAFCKKYSISRNDLIRDAVIRYMKSYESKLKTT